MNDFVVEQYFVPTDIHSYYLGMVVGIGIGACLYNLIVSLNISPDLDSNDLSTINNTHDYWLGK